MGDRNIVNTCPDCGGAERSFLAKYVYYWTPISLWTCACGLIYGDAKPDPKHLQAHWERAYKDEAYFEQRRAAIFNQLAAMASRRIRRGGSVLDVGGGMGHLLNRLKVLRPDVDATLLDISSESVDYARKQFGLSAICGTLADIHHRYDLVICSDVLYYEEDIKKAWEALDLISDRLLIRVPNKLWLIKLGRLLPKKDEVRGFNCEHRYILSRPYLKRRLTNMGYRVRFTPAAMLGRFGHLPRVITPAMVVTARRSAAGS